MQVIASRPRGRRSMRTTRMGSPRVATAVITIAVLAASVTACSHRTSGPAVASVASSATLGASRPSSSPSAGPLAYAECMRAHGVHDFPDPDSSGDFDLSAGGDLSPTNPSYQAAAVACSASGSAGKSSVPALSPAQIAASVQFAQCMRAHGVTNYPDPDSNGQIPGVRHFGVDPTSPQFQTADAACAHYMRGVPGWS